MKQPVRIFGIIILALIAILFALPFLINANQFRPALESRLSGASGREVKLGSLKLAVFSGGLRADDLSVADDPAFSPNPFLRAKSAKLRVEMAPLLFSHKLNVTALEIERPEIALIKNAAGKWNFSSLGAARSSARESGTAAPLDLSAKSVEIADGRFTLGRSGHSKPLVLENVNAELSDFSAGAAFPFHVSATVSGDGTIDCKGKAGPLNTADIVHTPMDAALKLKGFDLVASGLADPSTGIAGRISMDGTAVSDGRTLRIQGRLNDQKWTLARGGSPASRPLSMEVDLEHNLEQETGALKRGEIRIGKVAANLTGVYHVRGDSPVCSLKLSGANMPLEELASDLRALNIVLPSGSSVQGGAVTAHLAMEGPLDRLVTSGPIRIDNLHLAGFSLGAKLGEIQRLAGVSGVSNTDIRSATAELTAGPSGTTLSGIRIDSPSVGELTGSGTISPNHGLNFRMLALLRGSGGVLSVIGRKSDARLPFRIQGTASNPSFQPDVGAIAGEELQRAVGKSLGGDAGSVATGLLKGLLGGKK